MGCSRIKNLLVSLFTLCTFIYLHDVSAANETVFTITEFKVEGINPLTPQATDKLLQPYLGEHQGSKRLFEARSSLEKELIDKGFTFYRVILPAQQLNTSVITLRLVEFSIGRIEVEGNDFYTTENILNSMVGVEVGKAPDTITLSRSLSIANENPAKNTVLSLKAGVEPNEITAAFKVTDKNPILAYFQASNAGTDDTTASRLSIGFQHNNLFDKDHGLSLSYTTSPEDVSIVQQWGLSYRIPLYQHGGVLHFLLSDSSVDAGTVVENVLVKGKGSVTGVDYQRPLKKLSNYSHKVSLGVQQKQFDNNVTFGNTALGSDVMTQPATFTYKGVLTGLNNQTYFSIRYLSNIGGGSNNADDAYEASRTGALSNWSNIQLDINTTYRLEGSQLLMIRLNGQSSHDRLVSGEQFGVGGLATVRGYDERSVLGDSGYSASLEFRSQPFSQYGMRWVTFYDYGTVSIEQAQVGEQDSTSIDSFGLGLNLNYKQNLSLTVDIGQALKNQDAIKRGDNHLHTNLLYQF